MSGTTTSSVPINFVPGFYRNSTPADNAGYFIGGDKVRFKAGKIQKLAGHQTEIMSGSLRGVPRTLLPFAALDSQKYLAIGTHRQLAIALGGRYFDVTPVDRTLTDTDILTTVSGSPTVTIEHFSHGCRTGDSLIINTPVTFNGVTLSGTYEITVIDSDNYSIVAGMNASSSGGPGGGAITIEYLLPDGTADTGVTGFGWGASTYGDETWGTPRTSGQLEEARLWWISPWGEDVLCNPRGGALYLWDTSLGTNTRASIVSTAPDRIDGMLVSSAFRCVVLFGTKNVDGVYDPLLIRWSNSEDYTDYDTLVVGTISGEYRLSMGTKIVGACQTRSGEILVATDAAIYVMRPSTGLDAFEVTPVSTSTGILSPKSMFDVDGNVYLVTKGGFKVFNGTLTDLPTTEDIFIFQSTSEGALNHAQSVKDYLSFVREKQELWFWWADKNSTEINRYAILNIAENHICDGTMERTCYNDNGTYESPYAFDSNGVLYTHEVGVNADGYALDSYAEMGFYNIEEADSIMFVDKIIPDGTFDQQMEVSLKAKKYPSEAFYSEKTYTFSPTKGFISVRARGRFISLKIRSNIYNGNFRLGKFWTFVKKDGKR